MKEQTLLAKQADVAEIEEKLRNSKSVIFYDYRGLTVAEVTELRNKMRAAGVEYRVLKNTMVRRAAENLGIEGVANILEGPTAVAFGYEDPVAPAKVFVDFVKAVKKTEVKGGILDNKALDANGVKYLADLPSKEELIAKMLGSMNRPASGLVFALSGILKNLLYALNAIKGQKENA